MKRVEISSELAAQLEAEFPKVVRYLTKKFGHHLKREVIDDAMHDAVAKVWEMFARRKMGADDCRRYFYAVGRLCVMRLLAHRRRRELELVDVATSMALVAEQVGFLSGALSTGGVSPRWFVPTDAYDAIAPWSRGIRRRQKHGERRVRFEVKSNANHWSFISTGGQENACNTMAA